MKDPATVLTLVDDGSVEIYLSEIESIKKGAEFGSRIELGGDNRGSYDCYETP